MSTNRIRGHLRALLLAALSEGPAHGYGVTKALQDRTGGQLTIPEGSLYPALHRLEEDGLVASVWDESSRRRRRLYSLTPAGKEALDDETAEWQRLRGMIDSVLGVH